MSEPVKVVWNLKIAKTKPYRGEEIVQIAFTTSDLLLNILYLFL